MSPKDELISKSSVGKIIVNSNDFAGGTPATTHISNNKDNAGETPAITHISNNKDVAGETPAITHISPATTHISNNKDLAGETPAINEFIENKNYYLENGFYVFTAEYLKSRGFCCKSGCRHCPY